MIYRLYIISCRYICNRKKNQEYTVKILHIPDFLKYNDKMIT